MTEKKSPLLIDGQHRLQIWREYRRLSGAELERRCGVKAAFITQIEKGNSQPSLQTLAALASGLDITPGVLLDLDPRKAGPDMDLRVEEPNGGLRGDLLPKLHPDDREEVETVLRIAKEAFVKFIVDYANERKNARRRQRRKRAE